MLMDDLIHLSVDSCEDFFAFACSRKTIKTLLQVTSIKLVGGESLVKRLPYGYEYIQKFYQSCTRWISDGFTTEEVFAECIKDDGKCTEDELEGYGNTWVQFMRYTQNFFTETLFSRSQLKLGEGLKGLV